MADYNNGDRVVALQDLVMPANDEHPTLLCASMGDVLVIRDAAFETEYPWVVSHENVDDGWFGVKSHEIELLPNARLHPEQPAAGCSG